MPALPVGGTVAVVGDGAAEVDGGGTAGALGADVAVPGAAAVIGAAGGAGGAGTTKMRLALTDRCDASVTIRRWRPNLRSWNVMLLDPSRTSTPSST